MTHYMIINGRGQANESFNDSLLLLYDLYDFGMVLLRP